MPKLKNLSGADIVKIFKLLGFIITAQRGSHIKMKRIENGIRQTLTIPLHDELDKGTVKAIYNQALRYATENELHGYFYTN